VPVPALLGNLPCREFDTTNAHVEAIAPFSSMR
jgi:hypothetical protein